MRITCFEQHAYNSTCNEVSRISSMFEVLDDLFKELKTEYHRIKILENLGVLIKPTEVKVGSKKKSLRWN